MIERSVNGIRHRFEGDPATPLLWFLRDELGLSGTRFGCGAGLCGCCPLHVGKNAMRACITPLSAVSGASVTTIEGLGRQGLHPLPQAWVAHAVAQCGYCKSGQIMQAAALLEANPHPSSTDIDSAMAGNLCRGGTYTHIRAAIEQVASGRSGAASGSPR